MITKAKAYKGILLTMVTLAGLFISLAVLLFAVVLWMWMWMWPRESVSRFEALATAAMAAMAAGASFIAWFWWQFVFPGPVEPAPPYIRGLWGLAWAMHRTSAKVKRASAKTRRTLEKVKKVLDLE